MDKTERRRSFIIKILYLALWAGIIYCILEYALPLLMPFVIAYFLAFLLKPLINKISGKTRLSRRVTAILVLTLVYLVLGTLLVLLGAKLAVSLGQFFGALPGYYHAYIEPVFDAVGAWFDGFIAALDPTLLAYFNSAADSLSSGVASIISAVSQGAVGLLTGAAGRVPWYVVGALLMIISSYFFVVDYYKISVFITRQLSERTRHMLFRVKDFVSNVLLRFARAYLILLSITFVEVAVGLLVLQVPYAIPIALLTAAVDILPVLGTGTIMLPWAAYCLFTGDIFLGVGLLVVYGIITVVRQVLEPRVVGRQIGLYPLLTLICMFVGVRLFGFWGMLAFPVAITVLVYLNREGEISLFKE